MTTFSEQFPIVFQALNIGFLQTLKLFFVTLIGAIPLGLIISFGSMSSWTPLGFLRPLLKNLPKNTKLTWWQRFQIITHCCCAFLTTKKPPTGGFSMHTCALKIRHGGSVAETVGSKITRLRCT